MDGLTAAINAYRKVRTGDPIDDDELNSAIPFLKGVCLFLRADKDLFLAFDYINRALNTLEDFQRARKEKVKI